MATASRQRAYLLLSGTIEPEDDGFVSICPELRVASQGDTVEEALTNLREAIDSYLETLEEYGETDQVLGEKGVRIYSELPTAHLSASVPPGGVFSSLIVTVR